MPNLMDQEPTGYHEVIEAPKPPRRTSRKGTALVIAAASGAVVLGLAAFAAVEIKDARKDRNEKLAEAHEREVQRIAELQKTGEHIKTQDGTILLFSGSKIRTSLLQANPRIFGIVKDNIKEEVGDDEVVLISQPMVRKEGAVWLQAVPFSPVDGPGYSHKSAEGLADATIAVNLTGLLEKDNEKAVFCHGADDTTKYATVSENFSYVDENGNPTAFYRTMSSDDVEFLVSSGQLVCEK